MRWSVFLSWVCCLFVAIAPRTLGVVQRDQVITYRLETAGDSLPKLPQRFTEDQLATLEKLNRADVEHLGELPMLVVPDQWVADERAYTVLPMHYPSAEQHRKALVVHVPGQVFGAYERGQLVRWGPVSTGTRTGPTPEGLFFLNWKATAHISMVDPDWLMRWYFNFGNREGLAFHEYALPGAPASHGCIRLLQRDAEWLFHWGEEWVLDATGTRVLSPGTPVLIIGSYDFTAPPTWRSQEWLAQPVLLPPFPLQ
jgi:hypothetical protein